MISDSTQRFSDRVNDYMRYRPDYPAELVTALLDATHLDANADVADIGSGTGIFTRILLDQGLRVYAVEPNPEMRTAAEALLADYSRFNSIDAAADQTGLADHSIDLITAAQAFHWFSNDETRTEFRRILKSDGRLALVWNRRKLEQPFQRDYEAVLREHCAEYDAVNHMHLDEASLAGFFTTGGMQLKSFANRQLLDFDGLLGRVKSSSYCPPENTPQFNALEGSLRNVFDQYAIDNVIDFEYDTQLYFGPVE